MKCATDLAAELHEACKILETRFRILRVPAGRVPGEAWYSLAPELQEIVPNWLKSMLSQHAICNGFLEYNDPVASYGQATMPDRGVWLAGALPLASSPAATFAIRHPTFHLLHSPSLSTRR